jgi:hypothetical protein
MPSPKGKHEKMREILSCVNYRTYEYQWHICGELKVTATFMGLKRVTQNSVRFRYPQLDLLLSDDEKAAWNAFRYVVTGFLGNVNAVNFRKLVVDIITSYEKLGCNMSLKKQFLHSHSDSFSVNCGAFGKEEILLVLLRIESQFLCRSARSLSLYRLSYRTRLL